MPGSPLVWQPAADARPRPYSNTPPTNFVAHLSPEEDAIVLAIGCDARSLLYTAFVDEASHGQAPRQLDITCADLDPRVLAKHAVLYALLSENDIGRMRQAHELYYFPVVSQLSYLAATGSVAQLRAASASAAAWHASRFSTFMHLGSESTRAALHDVFTDWDRHMRAPPPEDAPSASTSARAAGPMASLLTPELAQQLAARYHQACVLQPYSDRYLNPLFDGECCVDRDPYAGAFLAHGFAAALYPTAHDVGRALHRQFDEWARAFRDAVRRTAGRKAKRRSRPSLVVRFLVGDALAVCDALAGRASHWGNPPFVAPWRADRLVLDPELYGADPVAGDTQGKAPRAFNVVDMSRVCDAVGLLNALVWARPLLHDSGVLYTETRFRSAERQYAMWVQQLGGHVSLMSVLLRLEHVAHDSGFDSFAPCAQLDRSVWISARGPDLRIDAPQLAEAAFDVLRLMLSTDAVKHSAETFARFLALARDFSRVGARPGWDAVIGHLLALLLNGLDELVPEICVQLHLYRLAPWWETVPLWLGPAQDLPDPAASAVQLVGLQVPLTVVRNMVDGAALSGAAVQFICHVHWQEEDIKLRFACLHPIYGHIARSPDVEFVTAPDGDASVTFLFFAPSTLVAGHKRAPEVSLHVRLMIDGEPLNEMLFSAPLSSESVCVLEVAECSAIDDAAPATPRASGSDVVFDAVLNMDWPQTVSHLRRRLPFSGVVPTANDARPYQVTRTSLAYLPKQGPAILRCPLPIDGSRSLLQYDNDEAVVKISVSVPKDLGSIVFSTTDVPKGEKLMPWTAMHRINLDKSLRVTTTEPRTLENLEGTRLLLDAHFAGTNCSFLGELSERVRKFVTLGQIAQMAPVSRFVRVSCVAPKDVTFCYLFINALRVDAVGGTFVLDAHVLPLEPGAARPPALAGANEVAVHAPGAVLGLEVLLPLWAERCRRTWCHRADCFYTSPARHEDAWRPLCACGEGLDRGECFPSDDLWDAFGARATRVAIGMPFELVNIQPSASDPAFKSCPRCGRRLLGDVHVPCARCRATEYCSEECLLEDEVFHAPGCVLRR